MNNWKLIPSIVFATVLIFGAGVFTGGLLVNHVKPAAKKTVPAPPATNCPVVVPTNAAVKTAAALPEILSKPFLMKLDEQLHLTADQHKAVEKIINEGQDDMKKVVRNARLGIREVLTPEQLKQFDSLMKKAGKKSAPAATTNEPVGNAATNKP